MSYPEEAPQRPLLELRILHAGTHQRHCHPVVTPGQGLLQGRAQFLQHRPHLRGGGTASGDTKGTRNGPKRGHQWDPKGTQMGPQRSHQWNPKRATNGTQRGPKWGHQWDPKRATNGTLKGPKWGHQ